MRKTKRVFSICFGLGIAAHLSLTEIAGVQAEQKVSKPLTTQFVKRQPRLSKPLELKKRPRPKQRRVERQMVAVQAKARQDQRITTMGAAQVVGALSRPRADVSRIAVFRGTGMEPQEMAQRIESAKEPAHRVDLSLEMMDVQAMDTGESQAMVIQDPRDRRNVRGFLHIAMAFPQAAGLGGRVNVTPIRRLAELGMNRWTGIRTDVWPPLTFDSSEILKVPWLFTWWLPRDWFGPTKLTESERRNLGIYLTRGGFLHADAEPPTVFEPYAPPVPLRNMIIDALDSQGLRYGQRWNFDKLPNTHSIYHCYFDFDGPPPGYGAGHPSIPIIPFMEGVTVDGRLLAVTSQMVISHLWGYWGTGGNVTGRDFDPTRSLQFGVNIIVFALTQEGSITHRVMDSLE